MLQTGAILCHEKMVSKGIDPGYSSKLIQYGWETITEALKHGGITGMMDRLDNPSKIKCFELAAELKQIMQPLYAKHQDDIITGHFSKTMMEDCAPAPVPPPLSLAPHPGPLCGWPAQHTAGGQEAAGTALRAAPTRVRMRTEACCERRACTCTFARAPKRVHACAAGGDGLGERRVTLTNPNP